MNQFAAENCWGPFPARNLLLGWDGPSCPSVLCSSFGWGKQNRKHQQIFSSWRRSIYKSTQTHNWSYTQHINRMNQHQNGSAWAGSTRTSTEKKAVWPENHPKHRIQDYAQISFILHFRREKRICSLKMTNSEQFSELSVSFHRSMHIPDQEDHIQRRPTQPAECLTWTSSAVTPSLTNQWQITLMIQQQQLLWKLPPLDPLCLMKSENLNFPDDDPV